MSNLTNHELEHSRKFRVTITEILKWMVEVEAGDQHEAEQIVSDGWNTSKHIFGSGDFVDVEFEAVPITDILG